MEFVIYFTISGMCAAAMFFAALNAARKPGEAERGPFRLEEPAAGPQGDAAASGPAPPAGRGRSGPWRPAR